MNKSEKIICLLLGAVLAWYIFNETGEAKERAKLVASSAAVAVERASATNAVAATSAPAASAVSAASATAPAAEPKKPARPSVPEKFVALENDDVKLTPALLAPITRLRGGIVAVYRNIICTPLSKTHALAVFKIYRWKYYHKCLKLALSIRRLFSHLFK